MVDRIRPRPDIGLVSRVRPVHRIKPPAPPRCQRFGVQQIIHDPCAPHQRLQIGRIRQKRRINPWRAGRVGIGQPDMPTALRTQHADMATEPMRQMDFPHVLIHNPDHEMQLQIRPLQCRTGAQKRPALGKRRGEHPLARLAPFQTRAGQLHQANRVQADHIAPFRFIGNDVIQMVLQVLPHTGQFLFHLDPVRLQFPCRPNPRQHQQFWRAKRPRRKDHLASRLNHMIRTLAPIRYPDGTPILNHHFGNLGPGNHRQVFAPTHRMQIGRRRRTAFALLRPL